MTVRDFDRWRSGLIALAAFVLAWRAAAFAGALASFAEEPATTAGLVLSGALSAMGTAFLLLGLMAFWRLDVPAARLFALYGALAGMHWGGPLQVSSEALQRGITLAYLVLSSVLGTSLLLHFALVFTGRAVGPRTLLFLYLPIPLAVLFAAVVLASPDSSAYHGAFESAFLALYVAQTNLYPLLAIVAIAVRCFRRAEVERREPGDGVALLATSAPAAVFVAAQLVNTLAPGTVDIAGLGAEPVNLCFLAEPIGFAYALQARARRPVRNPVPTVGDSP